MAPLVGMQEPTVAPRPKWQSGMTATCLWMKGRVAMLRICSLADSSICSAGIQLRVFCSIMVGAIAFTSSLSGCRFVRSVAGTVARTDG